MKCECALDDSRYLVSRMSNRLFFFGNISTRGFRDERFFYYMLFMKLTRKKLMALVTGVLSQVGARSWNAAKSFTRSLFRRQTGLHWLLSWFLFSAISDWCTYVDPHHALTELSCPGWLSNICTAWWLNGLGVVPDYTLVSSARHNF